MYGYQQNLQIQKQQIPSNAVVSNGSSVGSNRPNTSFGYKFNKPGEENGGAVVNAPNANQISKQQPYQQKRAQVRTNSNKLPEITNIQGSAKKSDKPGINGAQNGQGMSLTSAEFNEITQTEKDERFRYLLKHGTLKRIEANGNIIFCELPQILGIWVCYRRPCEREINLEKLNLDYMELTHMPLLEGEEKLKILTYQHNKISKIENLVSLPYLLYLDLYDNQLKDIESISTLQQLRVLLLPKNQITRISQIDQLTKLEVLDLHSNKIQKIEGIKNLVNLKILNLANNLIVKLENLESQQNLVELNLKLNLIEKVEGIQHLNKLEKLFLQNNRIDSLDSLKCLKMINSLLELNIEGNPVAKTTQQSIYYKFILSNTVNLKSFDHKLVDLIREDLKKEANGGTSQNQNYNQNGDDTTEMIDEKARRDQNKQQQDKYINGQNQQQKQQQQQQQEEEDEDINPEEVIEIIGEQWKLELNRVKKLELQNAKKKDYLQNILVEGGHAEIEDDTQLFIYGNAYEIVLSNDQFQEVIDKIQFQYIIFDFIIENQTLNTLKNFKKLKEIILKDNYLVTLLQLAKLEILPSLRSISIQNNPLQKCSFLKEFIVYRFPHINRINGTDVKESDKTKAKNLFSNFDRILQLPEKFYNSENIRSYPCENSEEFEVCRDKQYMKVFSKVATDTAEQFTQNLFTNFTQEKNVEKEFTDVFDNYLLQLIEQSPVLMHPSLHGHHHSQSSYFQQNKPSNNKTSHSFHSSHAMSSQINTTSPTLSINSNVYM